jgi:short-subunit dehydrogenase
MDFRDKVVVITGASTGIGKLLALELSKLGAKLVLASRDEHALALVAAECGGVARALVVPTDVGDPAQCERLVNRAVEAFGGIDVLVNNAGISMWARFEEITDLTVFERLMRVNYLGAVYCTHFALPWIKQRRGLLVAVSSLTGKTGVPTRSAYGATKHAMQGFFDALRVELRGTGVDVLVVSPGFVATDIRARALGPSGAPRGASPRDEKRGTMSVEECVAIIVDAMAKRRREVVMTLKAKLGMVLKLVAPNVVDAIAARAVREKDGA